MPRAHAPRVPPLDQRIGRALLGGSEDEGVIAIEGGRVVACTPVAAALLGVQGARAEGLPANLFISALRGELLQLRFQSALLDEAPLEFVAEKPGRPDEWVEARCLPLSPGMAFLLKDVTDRERSERSIRRKEQRLLAANRSLRLAHAAAHAASWEWRTDCSLRWLDLPAARDLDCLPPSWTEDEEIPDWRSLLPAEARAAFDEAMQELAQGGSATFELEVTGADGDIHRMRIDCAATERDGTGAPVRVSGVIVDITQAARAAEALREEVVNRKQSERRQQLLVHELNHRVKNMLSTVQSVARQSLAAAELAEPAHEFEERLMALAWTYEILTREHWQGAYLREVIERTLAPHAGRGSPRLRLDGPDLWLTPNRALSFALAFHELATNAVKYGALSNEAGGIDVHWRVAHDQAGRRLELEWSERGGPPVRPPIRRGFGSRLIERSLARELGGKATLSFSAAGLACSLVARLPAGPDRPHKGAQ
jgi:two-component sensor histidine kinase